MSADHPNPGYPVFCPKCFGKGCDLCNNDGEVSPRFSDALTDLLEQVKTLEGERVQFLSESKEWCKRAAHAESQLHSHHEALVACVSALESAKSLLVDTHFWDSGLTKGWKSDRDEWLAQFVKLDALTLANSTLKSDV